MYRYSWASKHELKILFTLFFRKSVRGRDWRKACLTWCSTWISCNGQMGHLDSPAYSASSLILSLSLSTHFFVFQYPFFSFVNLFTSLLVPLTYIDSFPNFVPIVLLGLEVAFWIRGRCKCMLRWEEFWWRGNDNKKKNMERSSLCFIHLWKTQKNITGHTKT